MQMEYKNIMKDSFSKLPKIQITSNLILRRNKVEKSYFTLLFK
jgi:hypothetical protein